MARNGKGGRLQNNHRRSDNPVMLRLKIKLALFNLVSKLVVAGLFIVFLPYITQRINLRQIDNGLIQKREKVISLIEEYGIEPFIEADSVDAFGSYNILKEEFISIERIDFEEDVNTIEVAERIIENEILRYRVHNYSIKVDGKPYLIEIGKSLESISQTERNIRKVIMMFIVFIIFITFITDLRYTQRLLKPLDLIINKLKSISTPSTFDINEIKTSTVDFRQLDRALIELMERLSELFTKEKEITVNISHELMTPVSVLRSKLENLLMKEGLDIEIEEKIEESLKTLQRLQMLINSLLMIARIESQQYLKNDTVQIKEVLQEVINELKPIAEDKGISVKSELSDHATPETVNRSLIFSMFYNVVNNAIKNTQAGGSINIELITDKGKPVVNISDTGRGMTPEQLKNLFLRFKSRDHSSGDGTGIGLAIAKTIADFHNIKINVTSEPGKGTKFSFIFS